MPPQLIVGWACALAVIIGGCGTQPKPQPTALAVGTVAIFNVRSMDRQHTLVIAGDQAVVQVAGFPGYADPRWYRVPVSAPSDWLRAPGDLEPPFVPGQSPPSRTLIANGAEQTVWFGEETTRSLWRWLEPIVVAVPEAQRLEWLPEWATSQAQIRRYLGL